MWKEVVCRVLRQPCFSFQFLLCSQTGNHPHEDLARFGYKPNVKVEKLKNSFTFWLPAGACCRNLVISSSFSKSGGLGKFFHKNPLYVLKP
jgi:hypothetical protein